MKSYGPWAIHTFVIVAAPVRCAASFAAASKFATDWARAPAPAVDFTSRK
jgi:hypothetical protein